MTKISDIIAKLQEIKDKHGDLEVYMSLWNGHEYEVNEKLLHIGITQYMSGKKEVLIEINNEDNIEII